jgi:predicted AAA+ superfamily ATPase
VVPQCPAHGKGQKTKAALIKEFHTRPAELLERDQADLEKLKHVVEKLPTDELRPEIVERERTNARED